MESYDYLAAAALARLPASTVASRRVRASGIVELWVRFVVKRLEKGKEAAFTCFTTKYLAPTYLLDGFANAYLLRILT